MSNVHGHANRQLKPRRPQSLRLLAVMMGLLTGCASAPVPSAPKNSTVLAPARVLAVDTPSQTSRGNTFVAPGEWSIVQSGPLTVLHAPEKGSRIGLIDVDAPDAAAAVAAAWQAFDPSMKRPLKVSTPSGPRDGWSQRASLEYRTSPNEHRAVEAYVRRANGLWTVLLVDLGNDVYEKRWGQISTVFSRLLPRGYVRENFAGRRANALDGARLTALARFLQDGMAATGVPGVGLGLVQNGKVVFAGGFGLRELGKPDRVDAQTTFLVASNTKALVTLMLGKLVDERKFDWDTPVTRVMPGFRLGDTATTAQVQIKHLICACTGMPRQDLEWLFEFQNATPATALQTLATMQPTSEFGKLFQYSNPMAAAAGYLGGSVVFPGLELGKAYDQAMEKLVFAPLGMRSTTHDFDRAERGNAAVAHAPDAQDRMTVAEPKLNRSVVHVRPAGGAWSTVDDMLKYVSMELADGVLPDGQRYISREVLLARRERQVAIGTDSVYGMGLTVNRAYGTPVVHHGGDMIGFHSDMMWLPEHGVGAVVLTNGDPGWLIRTHFRRKLLEVLFDGRPEADESVSADAKAFYLAQAAERRLLALPAEPGAARALASRYQHPAIGAVAVVHKDGRTLFDFGEWMGEMGSRQNPDGTTSFLTMTPGFWGAEFVVGQKGGLRTLTLRDGQHSYELVEQAAP